MHLNLHLSQVKITPLHLERKAVIYIRQSSPQQVREHLDSQLTQRTLVRRAQSLGWHPDRIEVFNLWGSDSPKLASLSLRMLLSLV